MLRMDILNKPLLFLFLLSIYHILLIKVVKIQNYQLMLNKYGKFRSVICTFQGVTSSQLH